LGGGPQRRTRPDAVWESGVYFVCQPQNCP